MPICHNCDMKMNWNDLVKARMKEIGMTQDGLSERMGVSQASVARYLNKKREPDLNTIALMMKNVGLKQIVLDSDGLVDIPENAEQKVEPYSRSFPVLDYQQAATWRNCHANFNKESIQEWQITTELTSDKCFWLKVEGDTMTGSVKLNFPEGTLILVDTERAPSDRDYIIAKLDNMDRVIFKQILEDAGQMFLRNIEPGFLTLPVGDHCDILGVVTEAKLKII